MLKKNLKNLSVRRIASMSFALMPTPKSQLHFVLVPLLAQGHMIPMIDMARLLAQHGVIVSLVTTPLNASRFSTIIDRATQTGLRIHLIIIPFPWQEVGLPPGCENLDSVPSRDLLRKFYGALNRLQQPLEQHLLNNRPSCIISDKCLSWTSQTARKFNVPRLVFHGMCCFSLLCSHNVKLYNSHMDVGSDCEPFLIRGLPLPQNVQITRAQLPGAFVTLPDLDDIRDQMREAESSAFGVVMNTLVELEKDYVELYENATQKKVFCIGPVSLCNKEALDKFERGNKASIDGEKCIKWLDTMRPKSVIYACLGSQCRLVPSQLIELGLGLESSNHPFIWVIKTGERFEELDQWLVTQNFEEKIKGRGLLIKGWAPQMLILSHPSIKCFLTHCGWNSTIEGICSGVPMITWPMFAEQFLNEKLIVEILKVGVRVGVEVAVRWGDEEKFGVLINKDEVKTAIERMVIGGEEMREKARKLGLMAMEAMEKGNGSSWLNIELLINNVIKYHSENKN